MSVPLQRWEKLRHLHGHDWAWARLGRRYWREIRTETTVINVTVQGSRPWNNGPWVVKVHGRSDKWGTRADLSREAKTRCLAMLLAEKYASRMKSLLLKLMKDKQYAEGWDWPSDRDRIFGCCKKRGAK